MSAFTNNSMNLKQKTNVAIFNELTNETHVPTTWKYSALNLPQYLLYNNHSHGSCSIQRRIEML